ncbi:hypothetical protein L1887_12972 [Cichorium endivia]|nr:hypothetical protein L1887_12972 [Cichorium endivia]
MCPAKDKVLDTTEIAKACRNNEYGSLKCRITMKTKPRKRERKRLNERKIGRSGERRQDWELRWVEESIEGCLRAATVAKSKQIKGHHRELLLSALLGGGAAAAEGGGSRCGRRQGGEEPKEDVQVAVPTSVSGETDHVGDSETAGWKGEGKHGCDGDDTVVADHTLIVLLVSGPATCPDILPVIRHLTSS